MKKTLIFTLLLSFTFWVKLLAQCDCMRIYTDSDYGFDEEKFEDRKHIERKFYKARFAGNQKKVVHFVIILKANKKYSFRTYDKRGEKTERIQIDILTVKRKFEQGNIDEEGKVKKEFSLYSSKEMLVYMELRVLEPEYSNCTCGYVVMTVENL